ncbi:MAG: MazF family transcriptional regulator [Alphaproteobacteria bacterium RIFCSPHIGHO2_12_FULL_63_12]|nr:MAG: MazF family transcriptional regulator [Alphaproteobacteria bacterium RIFCSPHIGHO2_12_FULL_63_12]
MQVAKWGNSLAVRLPAAVVEALGLKEGDDIELCVLGEKLFGVDRPLTLDERLDVLQRFRSRVGGSFRFDRDEANER